MKTVFRLIVPILLLVVMSPGNVEAEDPIFFDRSREGWFWFMELRMKLPKSTPEIPQKLPPTLKEMRERADALLARAIEVPLEENVQAYMAYQRLLTRRAEEFARIWQLVLWQHPELDPTVENPVTTVALSATRAEKTRVRDEKISELARTSGLIYFFSGDCPLCDVQSPILAWFSETYGFPIIPISLDGKADPLFSQAKVDQGAAVRLGVEKPLAIFLANPPSEVLRVGTGLLSLEDLSERLYRLSLYLEERNDEVQENNVGTGRHLFLGGDLGSDSPG
jgi:conjugal transfer pilus assembly protein TraF